MTSVAILLLAQSRPATQSAQTWAGLLETYNPLISTIGTVATLTALVLAIYFACTQGRDAKKLKTFVEWIGRQVEALTPILDGLRKKTEEQVTSLDRLRDATGAQAATLEQLKSSTAAEVDAVGHLRRVTEQQAGVVERLHLEAEKNTAALARLTSDADAQTVVVQRLREQVELLETSLPKDARIIVPVDQSGLTEEWGRSLLVGIRTYLRRRGDTVYVGGRLHRYKVEQWDDGGVAERAQQLAEQLGQKVARDDLPLAIVGPISSECAKLALPTYARIYEATPLLHLLPVPTGSDIFAGCPEIVRPCIFRMPPNNIKQAKAILAFVRQHEQGSELSVYTLLDRRNRAYTGDMLARIRDCASDSGTKVRHTEVEAVAQLSGRDMDRDIRSRPNAVVVIGPWHNDDDLASVDAFVRLWREREPAGHRTKIVVPDYPVAKLEMQISRERSAREDVYATFQLRPEFTIGHAGRIRGEGVFSESLIRYGYDAAALIDHAVTLADSTNGDKLARALCELGVYEGEAQPYRYRLDDRENAEASFHVYEFVRGDGAGRQHMRHRDDVCSCSEDRSSPPAGGGASNSKYHGRGGGAKTITSKKRDKKVPVAKNISNPANDVPVAPTADHAGEHVANAAAPPNGGALVKKKALD